MKFYVKEKRDFPRYEPGIHLVKDNWNDYGYVTLFEAHYVDGSENPPINIGSVSIANIVDAEQARKNKGTQKWPSYSTFDKLPKEFESLADSYVSLGNLEYYENLKSIISIKNMFDTLMKMKDIALDIEKFDKVQDIEVIENSFLRGVSAFTVKNQLHRVAMGGEKLIEYDFDFIFTKKDQNKFNIKFHVNPDSELPTNVYTLIGNNGSGKTTIIQDLASACLTTNKKVVSGFSNDIEAKLIVNEGSEQQIFFESIIYVSFSPFDSLKEDFFEKKPEDLVFKYIGNSKYKDGEHLIKSPKELTIDLNENIKKINKDKQRIEMWNEALVKLSFDDEIDQIASVNTFNNANVANNNNTYLDKLGKLSAGQKIILLGLSALISQVNEKTLVIIDEPESYLHPPLVSAYIRILTDILNRMNGVGIIATHSPIILQEIPKSCVRIISKQDKEIVIKIPKIETFGENIGIIMDEIFGLDIRNSGFYKFFDSLVQEDIERAKSLLISNIGTEAEVYLRILLNKKEGL